LLFLHPDILLLREVSCLRGRSKAANAAARSKGTYLAAHYARIKGRRGHKRAIVAVAHSILVIAWHLLTRNQPYTDLGGDYFLERQHSEAYKNRLVRQLERMGHRVTLEPAEVARPSPRTKATGPSTGIFNLGTFADAFMLLEQGTCSSPGSWS
jgi:hypothetical protein